MPAQTALGTASPDPRDIVDVVSQYLPLLTVTEHAYRGECPFCGSTAFKVRRSHGTFHCFGCGEGGDVGAFLAKIELTGLQRSDTAGQ